MNQPTVGFYFGHTDSDTHEGTSFKEAFRVLESYGIDVKQETTCL